MAAIYNLYFLHPKPEQTQPHTTEMLSSLANDPLQVAKSGLQVPRTLKMSRTCNSVATVRRSSWLTAEWATNWSMLGCEYM